MEYRIYITVPDLPVEEEAVGWGPLMEILEDDFGELGPVIGWRGKDAEVVMATDAADQAEAAKAAVAALTSALHTAKLGELYPVMLQVERAGTEPPVPA